VSTESAPPRAPGGPWFKFVEHDESQTELRVTFGTVPELHRDHAPLHILRRVLDDGLSSRLPFNIVERRGLAYSVQCNTESFLDTGLFEIDASSAPEKASLVMEEIWRTLAELCETGPTPAELERAKRRHRMFLEFAEDSPVELAAHFGSTEVFYPPMDFEQWCQRIEAETVESVRAAARKYFTRENLGVVAVGQKKGAKALEKIVTGR
jgi:predicted Zn-dependent peptidase